MPKVVDHEARRLEFVEALFRVAVRDGLGAASVRAVAAEAGVPAPRVQYYFPTKAALLDAALLELGRRIVGRGMALQEQAGPDATPEALLRAAIEGSRPIDDESDHTLRLFFLFLIGAITESSVHETQLISAQRFIAEYFAGLIRQAQERGEADPDLDAMHEARLILFANTGLNMAALADIHTVDDAKAALDHHLARVFTPKSQAKRSGRRARGGR